MKRNYLFAVGLLWAMIGMTACSKSEATTDYSTPAADVIAFTCSYSWGEGNEMIWTDKTPIGMFCEQTKSVNESLGVTALTSNDPQGTFYTKIPWGEGDYKFNLYVPFNKANTTTRLSGTIPQTQAQSGVSTNHIDQNALIYASVQASKSSAPIDVKFKQVLNYLDVGVSTVKWQGWKPELITLKAPQGFNLTGDYTFDLASGEFAFGALKSDSVAMNISGAELGVGAFHAFVLTAPFQTISEMTFKATMRVAKEGEDTKALMGTVTIPANVEGEQVVYLAIDLDEFKEEVVEDTSINLCDPNGMGVLVTANCYVAGLSGQTYRFDATVMGNGYTTPETPNYTGGGSAAGITPTPLDPKSAKLLWQTDARLISAVKLNNQQVYFTLNGTLEGSDLTEGNAVIAVYSGENATGDILWSWHIWVTKADLDANLQTYVVNDAFKMYDNYTSPQLMDRNLGATAVGLWGTVKNNAHGLKYQWGRKDPFLGSSNSAGNSIVPTSTFDADGSPIPAMAVGTDFTTDLKWVAVPGATKKLTKNTLAKYPMNLVYNAPRWLDEAVDDLWGYPNLPDESNNIGHKSIYDPCPPGYRVPHAYAITGMMSDPIGGAYTDMEKCYVLNKTTVGADFGTHMAYDQATSIAYWPCTGMINQTTGMLYRVGSYAYYWLCKKSTADNAFRVQFDTKNLRPKDGGYVTFGQSVRCMKEKEL